MVSADFLSVENIARPEARVEMRQIIPIAASIWRLERGCDWHFCQCPDHRGRSRFFPVPILAGGAVFHAVMLTITSN